MHILRDVDEQALEDKLFVEREEFYRLDNIRLRRAIRRRVAVLFMMASAAFAGWYLLLRWVAEGMMRSLR